MNLSSLDSDALKKALKEAIAETLREERELLRDVVCEALEDLALSEAIRDGRKTDPVGRDEVFDILGARE